MPVDLHLHTTASDGVLTPGQTVESAARFALKAIAITDHDTVDGVHEAIQAGLSFGVEIVPGVELSSDHDGRDVHILGYYIDLENSHFRGHLENLRQMRLERAEKMVERLKERGLDVALGEVVDEAGGDEGALGRAHVARVLLKKGLIDSIQEAFDRYIGRDAPCYVEKYHYKPKDVIRLIRQVGGVPSLAHPKLIDNEEAIEEFADHGLIGLEVYHSEHTQEDVSRFMEIARRYGLIATGGSDCHGFESSRGPVIGTVLVPDDCLDHLKSAHARLIS